MHRQRPFVHLASHRTATLSPHQPAPLCSLKGTSFVQVREPKASSRAAPTDPAIVCKLLCLACALLSSIAPTRSSSFRSKRHARSSGPTEPCPRLESAQQSLLARCVPSSIQFASLRSSILVRRASRLALFTPTNHVGFSLAARHRRWSGDHCGGLRDYERLVVRSPLILPSGSPLFRPFSVTIELTLVPHTTCFTFLHQRSHDSDGSAVLRCKSPAWL